MADLGEPAPAPLFLDQIILDLIFRGRKSFWKTALPPPPLSKGVEDPPPLSQGLDPSLKAGLR